MSTTVQLGFTCSIQNGQTLTGTESETGGNTIIELPSLYFPASTTNGAVSMAFAVATLQTAYLLSDRGGTLTTNGTATADVQTITITGTPTGGTFPLDFGGQCTDVAYNSSAATIQAALRALSTIGGTNITCTGGPLPGTPVVCTFSGTMVTGWRALMTTYSGSLTGGSSPAVAITHTTLGKPSNTIVLPPGIPYQWGASQNFNPCLFTIDVTQAFFTCTTAGQLKIRIVNS